MLMAQYTGRKSLAAIAAHAEGHGKCLTKTLGPFSLIGLGIGCIIGAGIFVLTGNAAANYAGPAIALSFVLSGIACAFVGLCYAELAAMIPASGSAYTYAYATVGEIFAWIIGWDLILEYGMGAATVAVGWSGYLVSLLAGFGIHFPAQWADATGTVVKLADGTSATAIVNLPAVLVVLVLTGLLMFGTKESTRVNNIMVAFKLFVVAVVIVVGAFFVQRAHWTPFIPENTGTFGHFGWSGILSALIFRRSSAFKSSSMMTNRKSTITAPAYTSTCTAARKNACSKTNSPARDTIVSTRNMALVTGLRLNGLATTRKPKTSVRNAKM